MEYFTSRIDHEPAEWVDVSDSTTSSMNLTAEQTGELIRKIGAVIEEAAEKYRDQKGEGVRRISVRSDVFPLASRTTRKEAES